MANLVTTEWLVENGLRSFPLSPLSSKVSTSTYEVPTNLLLDGVFCYPDPQAEVKLESIVRAGADIDFNFSNALSFSISTSDTFPIYSRTGSSLLVVGEEAINIPEGTHNFIDLDVDSSSVVYFGGAWLGVDSVLADSTTFSGTLNLLEGTQTRIHIPSREILELGVARYYGEIPACTLLGEIPNDCSDIISFINGVTPDGSGVVYVQGGEKVVVWDDPENHRIFIGLSFDPDKDVCKYISPKPEL